MTIYYFVISISFLVFVIASAVFVWSVSSNQYEDVERNGQDIFFDKNIKGGSDDQR